MSGPILAIETSCDETAAAVVTGRDIVSNVVASQAELHAPYGGVQVGLGRDDVREDLASRDDGGGRLVARGLDGEDRPAHAASGAPLRHMIIASSPLSE